MLSNLGIVIFLSFLYIEGFVFRKWVQNLKYAQLYPQQGFIHFIHIWNNSLKKVGEIGVHWPLQFTWINKIFNWTGVFQNNLFISNKWMIRNLSLCRKTILKIISKHFSFFQLNSILNSIIQSFYIVFSWNEWCFKLQLTSVN